MSLSTEALHTTTQEVYPASEAKLRPVYNMGKSIEISNVTVSFKTDKGIFTAVKDISLSVKKR